MRRGVVFILGSGLLATLAAIGYWLLFSQLPGYDDEGYILISARQYFEHGRLYDYVYSQYGPAFYVLCDGVQHLIGGELTHTSARFLTLSLWVGAAALCGALVLRLTRSAALAAFASAGPFLYLYFTPDEAFHPGSFIVFGLAASAYGLSAALRAGDLRTTAIAAGGVGALLALMKINVGVFYLVAIGSWSLLQSASSRARRVARIGIPVGLLGFAALLMKGKWPEPWVVTYLLVFGASVVGLVATFRGRNAVRTPDLVAGIIASFAVALAVVSAVLMRGTTWAGLWEGVIAGPLRHSANYSYPVDWRPGTAAFAIGSVLLGLAIPILRQRGRNELADQIIIGLRLGLFVVLLVAVALLMQARVIGAVFSYVAPSLWIWCVPLARSAPHDATQGARTLLAFTILVQFLQAFPIGGIQEVWSTFLIFPLVALGLHEVIVSMAPAAIRSPSWRWLPAAVLIIVGTKCAFTAASAHSAYRQRRPLRLPGAELLRLAEPQRTAYRILCLNTVVHADMLFSLPGMFSFNLWTSLPTPTPKNTTVWFTLLSGNEQAEIIAALERSARPCIIVEERLLSLMQDIKVSIQGPLVSHIFERYAPVFRLDGFAILFRREQPVASLYVAERTRAPGTPEDAPARLQFRIAGAPAPIASITVASVEHPERVLATLDHSNAAVTVTAIDRAGRSAGPSAAAAWPVQVSGLATIELTAEVLPPPSAAMIYYLRDATGRIVAEVRTSS